MGITFEFPALLVLLGLLPLLAVLQLILPRARRIAVSSLAFWRDAGADAAASSISRHRRLDLASVLLLALLAALLLAMSGPALTRRRATGVACTVIVDVSPSLIMTDGSPETRLARLRQRADAFFARLPPDAIVSAIAVPDHPGRIALQGRADDLRSRVQEFFAPSSVPLAPQRIRNRVLLAQSRTQAPVVLMTDLSPYDVASPRPPHIFLLATGGAATNVALTAAAVTSRDGRADAMLSVTAPDRPPAVAAATLTGDGLPEQRVPLPLRPGTQTWTFPVPALLPDRITLGIDVADDFAADNRIDLVRIEGRHYRIACVGRPDGALLALLAAAGAHVFESDQPPDTWPDDLDLAIFVDRLPPADFPHPAVLVNPPASFGPLTRTDQTRRSVASPWRVVDPSHPLTAHLPAMAPTIASFPVFQIQTPAVTVLATEQGDPLVARWGRDAAQRVAVLFDIDRAATTWPDEVSFVLFWDNCLGHLSKQAVTMVRYVSLAGGNGSLGEIEGTQTDGPEIDESAEALAAVSQHRRQEVDHRLPLWPPLVLIALVLVVLRTKVTR